VRRGRVPWVCAEVLQERERTAPVPGVAGTAWPLGPDVASEGHDGRLLPIQVGRSAIMVAAVE